MSEMQEHRTLVGEDIVCVGFGEWNPELPSNPHHLMTRLAQTNRILFIETPRLRRRRLAPRDLRPIARRLRDRLRGARAEGEAIVLSPVVLPFQGSRSVDVLNCWLLRRQVAQAVSRLGFHRPILWAYVPLADALIETLDPSLVVYDCVDDLAAQRSFDATSFRSQEQRLLRRAELVLASAPSLVERLSRTSGAVVYAPNVADAAAGHAWVGRLTEVAAAVERLRPIAEPRWSGEHHVVDRDDAVDVTAEVEAARGEAAATGDRLAAGGVAEQAVERDRPGLDVSWR
jgi:hypothetical protein